MAVVAELVAPARRALESVLNLVASDRFLVVTDDETRAVGDAFAAAATAIGAPISTYVLPAAGRPLTAVPADLSELVADRTAVVNAFRAIPEETPFRLALCLLLEGREDLRFGHAPGITEAMFRGGALDIDYAEMRKITARMLAVLDEASQVRIVSPAGTDLTLAVPARPFWSDVRARPGKGVNLPCGEVYCAPVEVGADGIFVCDATATGLGLAPAPLRMTVVRGLIEKIECEDDAFLARIEKLLAVDAEARSIGELGIGVNPGARISGNMLEDEKALGTCHIAFGHNLDMPGGRNASQTHNDFLLREPTLSVVRTDGTIHVVLDAGKFRG